MILWSPVFSNVCIRLAETSIRRLKSTRVEQYSRFRSVSKHNAIIEVTVLLDYNTYIYNLH